MKCSEKSSCTYVAPDEGWSKKQKIIVASSIVVLLVVLISIATVCICFYRVRRNKLKSDLKKENELKR